MASLVTQTALLTGRGITRLRLQTSPSINHRLSTQYHYLPPSVRRGSGTSALPFQSSHFSRQADHRISTTTRDIPAMSRPVGISMATADVLARSRAALREAELIDVKYAHLAACLNLRPAMPATTSSRTQTPPKEARVTTAISSTIRQSTQDRQSCRQKPDIETNQVRTQIISERRSNRWSFLDNTSKPTSNDKRTATQAKDLAATAAQRDQNREARRKRIADELQ
jgi:hypothetical protein